MNEDRLIEERMKKVLSFLKNNYNYIVYIFLAAIVWLAVYIRMLPTRINPSTGKPFLWDITLDTWTLGPDLDPFLFFRWAKYIVENGHLMAVDYMRNVPLGFNTLHEFYLHPFMMAWFHFIAIVLGISSSVEQSFVLYPVFMFAIAVLSLFLLTRKIFLDSLGVMYANLAGLIAALFFSIIPSLVPRAIAGIPDKQGSSFSFIFLGLYFFLCAWKSEKLYTRLIYSLLAGIITGALGLYWGGYVYLFIIISIAVFVAFIFNQTKKDEIITYSIWILTAFVIMNTFSPIYTIKNLLGNFTTLISIFVLICMLVHYLILSKFNNVLNKGYLSHIPKPLISLIISIIGGVIIGVIIFGPSFIISKFEDVYRLLITPVKGQRVNLTVAQNKQPYFIELANNFGPLINNFPLFLSLAIAGSITLYYTMMKHFNIKKERLILTLGFSAFILATLLSRYSETSMFNGTNFASLALYSIGFISLLASVIKIYYDHHKSANLSSFEKIDFGLLLSFSLLFICIISARGAVRLVMMLGIATSIMVGFILVFLLIKLIELSKKSGDKFYRNIIAAIFIVSLIAALYSGFLFYDNSVSIASSYAPSIYTQQWQKAMSWVRDNTAQTSVFAHWWDYGYWVQSIGNRATVLDGGNVIPYWNHLMGRYALTGTDQKEALAFLYSHNSTHFLIDSTDIGKYPAFSNIGSDEEYDRYSWLQSLVLDPSKIQEKKNSTLYLYSGGVPLDQDIIYTVNNTRLFLPAQKAGLGAVIIEIDSNNNLLQPIGIYVYQNTQYSIPLRYAFYNNKLIDYKTGIDSGIFIYPSLSENGEINKIGASLYLSSRTVNSQLARLYLYKESDPNFKLVHSEGDLYIEYIKSQPQVKSQLDSDFLYVNGGIRGPIRIWEINYPNGMQVNRAYLDTTLTNSTIKL
jgi:asparagine N-glycosylation enzyme membrane subunit Stt3